MMIPPLWLILGVACVFAFWWLADLLVVRPRSARLIVDGHPVLFRHKRDSLLVIAVMMALFMGVVVVGAIIEQDTGLLPPALLFGGFMVWSLRKAGRVTERTPSDADVRRGQAASRDGRLVIPLLLLTVATMYASAATDTWLDGWPSFFLFIVGLLCVITLSYLLWRFRRRWLQNRDGRHPIGNW